MDLKKIKGDDAQGISARKGGKDHHPRTLHTLMRMLVSAAL